MHDFGERDVQDSGQARCSTARDIEKKSIVLDDVDTSEDDELSSGSSTNLSLEKVARPSRARDTCIALHSAMPIMAHSAEQEEKQAEGKTNQTKRLGTRLHYPRV